MSNRRESLCGESANKHSADNADPLSVGGCIAVIMLMLLMNARAHAGGKGANAKRRNIARNRHVRADRQSEKFAGTALINGLIARSGGLGRVCGLCSAFGAEARAAIPGSV